MAQYEFPYNTRGGPRLMIEAAYVGNPGTVVKYMTTLIVLCKTSGHLNDRYPFFYNVIFPRL